MRLLILVVVRVCGEDALVEWTMRAGRSEIS
jgi:hypothetical protein